MEAEAPPKRFFAYCKVKRPPSVEKLKLAQAMARLGVETAMFDQGDRIAALRDAEVAKSLRSVLGKEFPIHLSRS